MTKNCRNLMIDRGDLLRRRFSGLSNDRWSPVPIVRVPAPSRRRSRAPGAVVFVHGSLLLTRRQTPLESIRLGIIIHAFDVLIFFVFMQG
jgi:hypothetical protein